MEISNHLKFHHLKAKTTNSNWNPDRIKNILEDKDGHYWLGIDGYGLCKYTPGDLTEDGIAKHRLVSG